MEASDKKNVFTLSAAQKIAAREIFESFPALPAFDEILTLDNDDIEKTEAYALALAKAFADTDLFKEEAAALRRVSESGDPAACIHGWPRGKLNVLGVGKRNGMTHYHVKNINAEPDAIQNWTEHSAKIMLLMSVWINRKPTPSMFIDVPGTAWQKISPQKLQKMAPETYAQIEEHAPHMFEKLGKSLWLNTEHEKHAHPLITLFGLFSGGWSMEGERYVPTISYDKSGNEFLHEPILPGTIYVIGDGVLHERGPYVKHETRPNKAFSGDIQRALGAVLLDPEDAMPYSKLDDAHYALLRNYFSKERARTV